MDAIGLAVFLLGAFFLLWTVTQAIDEIFGLRSAFAAAIRRRRVERTAGD